MKLKSFVRKALDAFDVAVIILVVVVILGLICWQVIPWLWKEANELWQSFHDKSPQEILIIALAIVFACGAMGFFGWLQEWSKKE